jgi:hypothetical protein
MISSSLITISNPGFHRKRAVAVGQLAVSWQVSAAGLLSANLPWRDAGKLAAELGRDSLLGAWVAFRSPQLGAWGGIVDRSPSDVGAGTVELSCDSFHALFRGVATRRDYTTATAGPGGLALNAVTDAATDRQLWLDAMGADAGGPSVSIDWRGDDLSDVLDGLAQDSGWEWTVELNDDWTISFAFRKRIGANRLGSVLFADGYNVTPQEGAVQPTLDGLANEIRAVPGDQAWESAAGAVAVDADSVVARGRHAQTRRYVGLSDTSSLYTRAVTDLARSAQPAIPVTISVPVTDRYVRNAREGDSVRYWSSKQNARYELRIATRSYDADAGLVRFAGDASELAA